MFFTTKEKNHLRKLHQKHPPSKIRDTSRTPYNRRKKTRLSWRPKFSSIIPPQRENSHQQHHLTRKKKRKIHVHRHQELLSGNFHELFPIHVHPQKMYSPRGTRKIQHHLRKPRFHLSGNTQRHLRPKRSRRRSV